mgnify:CR=1 FL=1|jgi:endoglucanase
MWLTAFCFSLTIASASWQDNPVQQYDTLPSLGRHLVVQGGIVRGDTTRKQLALVFTGHEFADGGHYIAKVLKQHKVPASFFFTGAFYRNKAFRPLIQRLKKAGHYLGAHSDAHLLYCDWTKRDSLLVTQSTFTADLLKNYEAMQAFHIGKQDALFFLPPYEWYNDTIAKWVNQLGIYLINFTPGTRSNADYTVPGEKHYVSSKTIFDSIIKYEETRPNGLNGFLLLLHIGTHPKRTDKFYYQLPSLVSFLKQKGYDFVKVDDLLRE